MAGLQDIKIIEPDSFKDHRGEIYTIFDENDARYEGIKFNHDKICTRRQGTLVGIHGDFNTYKLVTCLYGEVYSVLVDNRVHSKDYLKSYSYTLSAENKKQLLIPPGIGNSFLVLSDECVYNYKLSYYGRYVDADEQFTLRYDDPKLDIQWNFDLLGWEPILSDRDKNAPLLP